MKIDSLSVFGIRALQQLVFAAQAAEDDFMAQLCRIHGLDPSKKYVIADDGTVIEVPSLVEVRRDVQKLFSEKENGNR